MVPAYNEEARLPATLDAIAAFGRSMDRPPTVLLVDDGSTDQTANLAEESARRLGLYLTIMRLAHGGKAAAVRAGMLHAAAASEADYLLMLDADNEISVDHLHDVPWTDNASTVYIGRRMGTVGSRSSAQPSPFRRFMSLGMRTLSRLLLGLRYTDTQCGFKLFPRRLAIDLFSQQRSRSWVFDAEILVIALRSGLPIIEVPVAWNPRGASRVRPTAAVTSLLAVLAIAARRAAGGYRPVTPSLP